LAPWIFSGFGKVVVGLIPENTNINLQLLGALNVPLGSVAILLLSVAVRRGHAVASIIGVVVAVVGLAGSFLPTAGQYAGPSLCPIPRPGCRWC
jgi:hypothetical protein